MAARAGSNAASWAAAASGLVEAPALDRRALHAIRLLFDAGFYLTQYADVAASGIEPLDHFLTAGLNEGRTPCCLFDPGFYLLQPGAPANADQLFLHYLRDGVRSRVDPHPLVDSRFYAEQEPALQEGTNPLVHMLGAGRREDRRPNRLFDPAYYRRRLRGDQTPHALIHYALRGWRDRLQPHPLFDPESYLQARPDVASAGADPLAHYLRHGHREQIDVQPLFDAIHYAAHCSDQIEPVQALLHFAEWGTGPGRSPHPLFDVTHYLHQNPDLAESGIDPFLHFLEFGIGECRDPHPLFDSWFYRSNNPDVIESGVPPFLHYVRHGIAEGRDPNPFFPAAIYTVHHPAAASERAGPLAHFLHHRQTHLQALSDEFDPAYYLACHPGCEAAWRTGLPPLAHYLAVGRTRRHSPVPQPIARHGWAGPERRDSLGPVPGPATPLLLIVQETAPSDRASCALHALQHLVADPELECRVVIRQEGSLASAFSALAPTVILPDGSAPADTDCLTEILYSFQALAPDGIVLVNSAAMGDVVGTVATLRLRLLAWLHEMPLSIDSLLGGERTMRSLADTALRIVTNSETARTALLQRYGLPAAQVAVIADGIARKVPGAGGAAAGPADRDARMAERERLHLPSDALIVLGSGSVGFAHGTDLFIRVAAQVWTRGLSEAPIDSALRQAFFLWMGPSEDPLFAGLCQHDIDRLGLSERVRLLGLQDEPGRLLAAADLFLLTTRELVDSVASLEAGRVGIPVIAFAARDGAVGAQPPSGLLVPYLDLDAMSDIILVRGNRPARRRRAARQLAPGPSWADWHCSLRLLLSSAYGIPFQPAANGPADATAPAPVGPGHAPATLIGNS